MPRTMTDVPDPPRDYRDTVFLPRTDFPMKAGLAAKEPAILERWKRIGVYDRLREQLNELGRSLRLRFQATGLGGVMNTHWSMGPIRDPSVVMPVTATVRRLFQLEMIERGYYVSQRGMINLSLPMQQSDLDGFVTAVRDYLTRYASPLRA